MNSRFKTNESKIKLCLVLILSKIKKITWGDTTGLKVKINNKKAADSFAARHDCKNKTYKTKAGYWACRLPHYAKQLGLSGGGDFFW